MPVELREHAGAELNDEKKPRTVRWTLGRECPQFLLDLWRDSDELPRLGLTHDVAPNKG